MKIEKQKLKFGLTVLVSVIIGILLGAYAVYSASPSSTFTISSGIYPGAPSFTVWVESGNYFAKNATGVIVFSGTNASQIINDAQIEGRTTFLQAGVYQITNTILQKQGVTIKGEGRGRYDPLIGTILVNTGNYSTIKFDSFNSSYANGGCKSQAVENLMMKGSNSSLKGNIGIEITNSLDFHISNVYIYEFYIGINITAMNIGWIENTYLYEIYDVGIKGLARAEWEINELTLEHVEISQVRGTWDPVAYDKGIGIWLDNIMGVKMSDCGIGACNKEALRVDKAWDLSIVNCDFDYSGLGGLINATYFVDGVLLKNVTYSRFTGNWFGSHYGNGLKLYQCENNTITGNTFAENGLHGLLLDHSNKTAITGNFARKNSINTTNYYFGICLSDSLNCTVESNVCIEDYAKYGIGEAGASDYNIILGNVAKGQTAGIYTAGAHTISEHNL